MHSPYWRYAAPFVPLEDAQHYRSLSLGRPALLVVLPILVTDALFSADLGRDIGPQRHVRLPEGGRWHSNEPSEPFLKPGQFRVGYLNEATGLANAMF